MKRIIYEHFNRGELPWKWTGLDLERYWCTESTWASRSQRLKVGIDNAVLQIEWPHCKLTLLLYHHVVSHPKHVSVKNLGICYYAGQNRLLHCINYYTHWLKAIEIGSLFLYDRSIKSVWLPLTMFYNQNTAQTSCWGRGGDW